MFEVLSALDNTSSCCACFCVSAARGNKRQIHRHAAWAPSRFLPLLCTSGRLRGARPKTESAYLPVYGLHRESTMCLVSSGLKLTGLHVARANESNCRISSSACAMLCIMRGLASGVALDGAAFAAKRPSTSTTRPTGSHVAWRYRESAFDASRFTRGQRASLSLGSLTRKGALAAQAAGHGARSRPVPHAASHSRRSPWRTLCGVLKETRANEELSFPRPCVHKDMKKAHRVFGAEQLDRGCPAATGEFPFLHDLRTLAWAEQLPYLGMFCAVASSSAPYA